MPFWLGTILFLSIIPHLLISKKWIPILTLLLFAINNSFKIENKPEATSKEPLIIIKKYNKKSFLARGLISSNPVYFSSKRTLDLETGDCLVTKCKWKPIYPNKNPGLFDFNQFLINQDFEQKFELKDSNDYQIYNVTLTPKDFITLHLPNKIKAKFKKFIPNHWPWATAIFLGQKQDLTKNQKTDIQNAGIAHLFAISGMHVGLLYILLSILFKKLPNNILLELLSLWTFCGLCAFTPSVVRATVMISFVLLSNWKKLDFSANNLLALSALIMLCINPQDLKSISFQFSFGAVWAIFNIYPKVKELITSKYKIINWLLSSIFITFSIQITLFPLQLYYFGGIALASLISNLIFTIPITLALYLNTILVLNPLDFINILIGWILESIYQILENIQSLQIWKQLFMEWKFPYFSPILFFFFTVIYASKMRRYTLISILISSISLFAFQSLPSKKNNQLIFFQFDKHMCIESDSTVYFSNEISHYYISQYNQSCTKRDKIISDTLYFNNYKQSDYFLWKQDTIQIIDKKLWWYPKYKRKSILYLRNNSFIDLDLFFDAQPKLVLLEGSCSEKYRKFIKNHCREQEVTCIDLYEKGAYIYPSGN